MKIVGLTGGIGSGKTTVSKLFKDLGIPVYIADEEAKKLMQSSKVIKQKLSELFGSGAYVNGELNREYMASKIFNNDELLKKMNAIIHPAVRTHFKKWAQRQTTKYVIKEAAIIFEHNTQSQYDYVITVIADEDERIKRLLKRDNTTKEKILAIMKHQLSDDIKAKRSDFVIVNDKFEHTKEQVLNVHHSILKSP